MAMIPQEADCTIQDDGPGNGDTDIGPADIVDSKLCFHVGGQLLML